ncbi:pleckstrin domain containing family A member 8 [Paragonimus westermani]|uniref:Pleckstrin homology domain-containing family A member 8 n=1 Tax=Paragonimus westermani TaxID=34504 RepID=A0A5J4NJT3_9TREM|nr:pleckstrin domain containing family A member 8 [Paragonimus westermani]
MEGFLFKWTNYMTGWQQRWFTLKDGVLSYYRSQEEVDSGCKGSVKLAVCDVIVHSSDPRRFDLILGEQRFYLRALSRADRQRWVVALGSCKAGGAPPVELDELRLNELHTQSILTHQSELRIYHNLILQQVKELQGNLKEDSIPDMARINEVTGTLNAACSTFLVTLNELLSLTQSPVIGPSRGSLDLSTKHSSSPPNAPLASTLTALQNAVDPVTITVRQPLRYARVLVCFSNARRSTITGGGLYSWFPGDSVPPKSSELNAGSKPSQRRMNRAGRIHHTFFSTMEYSFEDLRPNMDASSARQPDSQLLPGDYLAALDFVQACRSLFTIFERLSTATTAANTSRSISNVARSFTALQQVQADLNGNLSRLELALSVHSRNQAAPMSPQPRTTQSDSSVPGVVSLGSLIRDDITNNRIKDDASVYMAVLWLARSLNFVREFLHLLFTLPQPSVVNSQKAPEDDSLSVVATEAYARCLRSFHQWSLRGVAMIVIKSLPSRNDFLHVLLQDSLKLSDGTYTPLSVALTCHPELYAQLEIDAKHYSDALGRTLTLIEGLFACLDLERVFTGSETY